MPALDALMVFNLAPLKTRRDVAMLGVVHRAVLKKGPPQFWKYFEEETTQAYYGTRAATRRHFRHLKEHRRGRFLEVLRRSALGLVAVYNLLPGSVVSEETVHGFQGKLVEVLRSRACDGCADWPETYSPRIPMWRHPLR